MSYQLGVCNDIGDGDGCGVMPGSCADVRAVEDQCGAVGVGGSQSVVLFEKERIVLRRVSQVYFDGVGLGADHGLAHEGGQDLPAVGGIGVVGGEELGAGGWGVCGAPCSSTTMGSVGERSVPVVTVP